MCINTSNFFTRSRPIWERRGSLTLPAPLALPRLRGGDPGSSEVRTTPPRSPLPAPGRPDPARRSAPRRSSAGAGTPSRHRAGVSAWGPPRARGSGVICSPPWLLFTFSLRHLGSTWRFGSLGDNLPPPNEAQDSS